MEVMKETVERTNRWKFTLNLGFFAGLIWGAAKICFYYLGLTKVIPGFLAEPFYKHDMLASLSGHLIGWLYFVMFSVVAAFIYLLLFSKIKGPWAGIVYGLTWWSIIYLYLGPINGMMKWIDHLDWNSILVDASLFTLWGLFIGYTIAVEFNDEQLREPFTNN